MFSVLLCVAIHAGASAMQTESCTRDCLKGIADRVFESMVDGDPAGLPLSRSYAATENSQPAAIPMMSPWRTAIGITQVGQYIIDPQAGQIFFTASLDENGVPALLMARLKVEDHRISELELYINRSRADSGFLFQPEALANPLNAWTEPVPKDQRATREELLKVGKAIFDTGIPVPESAQACVLMEMGGMVYEDPDYLPAVMDVDQEFRDLTGKERITIPCGLIPNRPTDPDARVEVIDEEQGIVVSFAIVHGYVSPYLVTGATESCFVPDTMIKDHRSYLKALDSKVIQSRKVLREMPASVATVEVVRFHSNRIQGMHRYMNLQGPGAVSPWVSKIP